MDDGGEKAVLVSAGVRQRDRIRKFCSRSMIFVINGREQVNGEKYCLDFSSSSSSKVSSQTKNDPKKERNRNINLGFFRESGGGSSLQINNTQIQLFASSFAKNSTLIKGFYNDCTRIFTILGKAALQCTALEFEGLLNEEKLSTLSYVLA